MKHIIAITVVGAALAGCSNLNLAALRGTGLRDDNAVPVAEVADSAVEVENSDVRPPSRPEITEIDDVTAAPKPAVSAQKSGPLGVTVASLGNPAETGLWLKTPMVQSEQTGRISYNGKTIDAILIPIDGAATAGSRMSLHAFQALGAPLTDLVEVNVAL
jgi:hypothetical protein